VVINYGYVQNINISSCFLAGLILDEATGFGCGLLECVPRLQIYSHIAAMYVFDWLGVEIGSGLIFFVYQKSLYINNTSFYI
jgi:hypothetical protein